MNKGQHSSMKSEQMACQCGGYWGSASAAGAFAMNLDHYRTSSNGHTGGRASFLV